MTILESVGGIDVLIDRFALNDYQVDDLLVMPVKETDTRHHSFINMFPDAEGCYGLDAFDPDQLMRLTEKTINAYYSQKPETADKIRQWTNEFKIKRDKIMQIISK